MINPLDSTLFLNKISIPDNGFEKSDLILSILISNETIIIQYLVLKHKDKEKYMICGFDFINEKIFPVEIRNIESLLIDLRDFLESEYNTMVCQH
jgi:hypothetical protein